MNNRQLVQQISTSWCEILLLEDWDAPPGRFFVAFRGRHGFSNLIGNGVVEEFRTLSGPIFFAPAALCGAVYDVGMRLADARDPEAPIDQGWPPLTVGLDVPANERQPGWEEEVLESIYSGRSSGASGCAATVERHTALRYSVEKLNFTDDMSVLASVIVTDAPLLPAQLERLADRDTSPVTVAVATGNRLPRVEGHELQSVSVLSEDELSSLCQALKGGQACD